MHDFIPKLEHMQRTQNRHLARVGKQLKGVARAGGSTEVMVRMVEAVQGREEGRLDPAARELATIMPASYVHYARAVDLLVTVISVMATRVNGTTLHHIDEAVNAGFELIILLDDVDFVSGLTENGSDMHALHVVAQFLCALKGWLLATERLTERAATMSVHQGLQHMDPHVVRHHYARFLNPPPRTPKGPRPPEAA